MAYRYKFAFDPSLKVMAAAFGLAANALDDFRPVWKGVANIAGAGMLKNIEGQGGPIGARWSDPGAAYARQKLLQGFGKQPLRRTGALLDAFAGGVTVLKEGPRWALFGIAGSEAVYGKILHTGRKPKGKLVKGARRAAQFQFASWSDVMTNAYDQLLGGHVEGILDKAVKDMRRG